MNTALAAADLRRARTHLLKHGDCPSDIMINERVARSWQRSLAAGLLPTGRLAEVDHLTSNHLRQLLSRNHDLLSHSRPVMEYLYEQMRHSHSMIILADQQATLMQTMGDVDFLTKAERVALSIGASWQEGYRGTNAIGTALAEVDSVEINGSEHFLERNGFLTCAAAPIMAADGSLLGVIDVSGDNRSRHPHTLGLVGMAARMIENRLLLADRRYQIRLRLHAYPEGIGTVAEGIIALSEEGRIIGSNRAGLAMLRLNQFDLGVTMLNRVIESRLDNILSPNMRNQPQQIRLQNGSVLFAQVHVELATIHSHVVTSEDKMQEDALAALDSGDVTWRKAANQARRIMGKQIPLLIHGESGVGKEYFARAVHKSGPHSDGPFIAINCSALPENLIEAELFGYSSGAFTGARREGYQGRLREAHGGTLFLDEIGDMPLSMQTRLLRVLQERKVMPLGGGKEIDVEFDLICATHRKLREEVDKGTFRRDLYYRINGLAVHLPALRERSDIQVLSERILHEINPGRRVTISPGLVSQFSRHSWPGNLRQYANMLRTSSAMLEEYEHCIERRHLPEDLLEELTEAPKVSTVSRRLPRNLKELSLSVIRQTLEECHGNVSKAARHLGISRQTLYRKLKGS